MDVGSQLRLKITCLLSASGLFLAVTGLAAAADVKVYALSGGVLKTQTQYLLKDTRVGTPMDIPIPFLLVKHGRDWVAFDTGCNAKVAKNPVAYWGEEVVAAFEPVIRPDELFQEAIKKLGLTPNGLKAVICSHGHLDHAGGIDSLLGTRVPIYFQGTEMAGIRGMIAARKAGAAYILGDFEHLNELNIQERDGVFDIFGDKSVIAFPTPGHTPGHQSLYVKPSRGDAFIYCADALYTLENMERFIPPSLAADIPATMQNINWFKLAERMGLKIVPSHDPAYWSKHAWAPRELFP